LKLVKFFIYLLYLPIILVLTMAIFALLSIIQSKLFLPKEFVLWVFKSPGSELTIIFEFYLILFFFRKTEICSNIFDWIKSKKRVFYPGFIIFNVILVYYLLFNVTVITTTKIVDHSALSPQGRLYTYNDIVGIEAGVYGKPKFPFRNKQGEFFYIVKLSDGQEINLNDSAGGVTNDVDIYKVFEELDANFVSLGVEKKASMANFKFLEKNLDKIYSDRIKTILTNIK